MQVDLDDFKNAVASFLAHPSLPQQASDRYAQLKTVDPYPQVPSALLHAGHVASYLAAVGIVEPFEPGRLTKPATYLVPLEGLVRYVDQTGAEQRFFLSRNPHPEHRDVRSHVIVESNAVCYVTLQPTFRFPAYIAARFNLLIRDVYRGLLVGTGPLVDPGFVGQLSIPIHNFTSNKYRLEAGEGFVYFEFTKLSWRPDNGTQVPAWIPGLIESQPPFPADKTERQNLDDYILSAVPAGDTPRNAIVAQTVELKKVGDIATNRINQFTVGGAIAAIALLATVLGTMVGAWQVYLSAEQFVNSADAQSKASLAELEKTASASSENLSQLKREISDLRENVKALSQTLDALRAKSSGTPVPSPPYEELRAPSAPAAR